jgi:hypothetical protein
MTQRGLATDRPDTIFLTGRDAPVLVVFDRNTMHISAIIAAD